MKMVSLEGRAAEAHGRGHDKPIIDLEGGQYGKYRLLKRPPSQSIIYTYSLVADYKNVVDNMTVDSTDDREYRWYRYGPTVRVASRRSIASTIDITIADQIMRAYAHVASAYVHGQLT